MGTKKIIIVSALKEMQSFFMLEALNFDLSVECTERIDKIHNDLSSFDLAIIDIDTVKQMPLNSAKKQFTVSTNESTDADIAYPCLISDLKRIYNDLYTHSFGEDAKKRNSAAELIFYKNQKNIVSVNMRKYILSDAEYKILTILCKSPHKIVLREEIQKLFENGKSNIGDVYICRLRKKLEDSSGRRLILTVREKGYKIVADVEWR